MQTNNPTALPTVVLGQGNHMNALADSFNTILKNMETTAQIEAAKREKLDQSLIPPEVDWDNIYHKDTQYIKSLVDDYTNKALGYWQQGINHMNPGSGDAYAEMRSMENQILNAAAQSAQDKKIDEEVVKTMTKNGFAESFDLPETMKRLSDFRSAPLTDRRNYLNSIGGFYQESAFDWNKFAKENMPDNPDKWTENKSTKGGYTSFETVTGYSPKTIANVADNWLQDPKYLRYASTNYNALSEQTRQQFETLAAKDGISGLQLWARMDVNKMNYSQRDLKYQKSANTPKGSGDRNTPTTFDLATRVAAIDAGDPDFFTSTTRINNRDWQVADMPMMKFGTYKDVNIAKNNAAKSKSQSQNTPAVSFSGNGVTIQGGESKENAFVDNYLEGIVRDPKTGEIWVTTTEANSNQVGSEGSDGRWYFRASNKFWTDFLNGAVNGTEYSKSALDKFVKSSGAMGADGVYDVRKFLGSDYFTTPADDNDVPDNLKK